MHIKDNITFSMSCVGQYRNARLHKREPTIKHPMEFTHPIEFCNKFLVRLHVEYNTSVALWKHQVNLLLQSFPSVSSDLCQC